MKLIKFLVKAAVALAVVYFIAFVLAPFAARQVFPVENLDLIERYSEQYGVPPERICAVIMAESGFREDAVSDAGAIGLMQITPQTLDWLQFRLGEQTTGSEVLFDAQQNIKYGVYFLSLLADEFSDERAALAGYNAGRGQVNSWLSDSRYSSDGTSLETVPFPETDNYVKKVLRYEKIYRYFYF